MLFVAPFVALIAGLPAFGLAVPADAARIKAFGGKGSLFDNKPPAKAAASTPSKPSATPAATTPSKVQIDMAVTLWRNDTGKVSKFLNTATSYTGDEFTRQATIAYNAEVDELNHKAVLDAAYGTTMSIKAANDTLATKGSFQAVVDALKSMMVNGPDTAQSDVDSINANRCVNVLPNIDAYFMAAGSTDMSIRPTGCLELASAQASGSVSINSTSSTTSAESTVTAAAQPMGESTEESSTMTTTSTSAKESLEASTSSTTTSATSTSTSATTTSSKSSTSAKKTSSAAPRASAN